VKVEEGGGARGKNGEAEDTLTDFLCSWFRSLTVTSRAREADFPDGSVIFNSKVSIVVRVTLGASNVAFIELGLFSLILTKGSFGKIIFQFTFACGGKSLAEPSRVTILASLTSWFSPGLTISWASRPEGAVVVWFVVASDEGVGELARGKKGRMDVVAAGVGVGVVVAAGVGVGVGAGKGIFSLFKLLGNANKITVDWLITNKERKKNTMACMTKRCNLLACDSLNQVYVTCILYITMIFAGLWWSPSELWYLNNGPWFQHWLWVSPSEVYNKSQIAP
jgi:hypothetical protein